MMMNAPFNPERFENTFCAYETHTLGEPTRIITSGFPMAKGITMLERKNYLESHCDAYRSALMCEPRGHKDMVGAVLMAPINPAADLGVIYMDANRWINMCGHASMGCATVAVEAGLVPVKEPYTGVVLDTPAGIVATNVKVYEKKALEVTITNVPSFLYMDNITHTIDDIEVTFDIAFGGSFFALIDANKLEFELSAKNIPSLITFAAHLIEKTNKEIIVSHPTLNISGVANAEFYSSAESSQRNIVISAEGQVDRSPCGTGTSAKLAALYAHGQIKTGEVFVNENFTGAKFKGMVKEEISLGSYKAIIPEITGSAYISGYSTYVIDTDDPLKYGFLI